mmetsp:Transcript_2087/g.6880  ORF Transcript_2087/g.6880 Transcript_2087/m.6880 type:complete len:339 (-) Transcript_2087:1735-2751(-)
MRGTPSSTASGSSHSPSACRRRTAAERAPRRSFASCAGVRAILRRLSRLSLQRLMPLSGAARRAACRGASTSPSSTRWSSSTTSRRRRRREEPWEGRAAAQTCASPASGCATFGGCSRRLPGATRRASATSTSSAGSVCSKRPPRSRERGATGATPSRRSCADSAGARRRGKRRSRLCRSRRPPSRRLWLRSSRAERVRLAPLWRRATQPPRNEERLALAEARWPRSRRRQSLASSATVQTEARRPPWSAWPLRARPWWGTRAAAPRPTARSGATTGRSSGAATRCTSPAGHTTRRPGARAAAPAGRTSLSARSAAPCATWSCRCTGGGEPARRPPQP